VSPILAGVFDLPSGALVSGDLDVEVLAVEKG